MNRAQRRAAWLDQHRSRAGPAVTVPAPPSRPSRPAVRLHIGELALHGMSPLSRRDLGDAVKAELSSLIVAEGLPAQLRAAGRTDRLRGTRIRLHPGDRAAVVGSQIARSVFRGHGR